MKNILFCLLICFTANSCLREIDDDAESSSGFDNIVLVNNINTGSTPVAYLGTRKNLSSGTYTNARAHQVVSYPLAQVYGEDVFLLEGRSGDKLFKYTRRAGGMLEPAGMLTMPSSSFLYCIAFESAERAYISLGNAGKIIIFNPASMTQTGSIDLSSYALGDASPDPGVILYRNGKLYVACLQTSDGITSSHPAQLLVIDLENGKQVTSITDSRATYASNPSSPGSMFFSEEGDLYLYCMSSWGFVPGQRSGFLRIRNGEDHFDPSYFFNISDYYIANIQSNKLDYLHRMEYAGNGIVYATGNIPGLASNPPDYVKDKTYGAFRADLGNKIITKLDIPNSNGYAACVMPYNNKVYFGMSTNAAIGIYEFDPATNTTSAEPVVKTQGDPSVLCHFK
jgi:hypothetical protein